MWTGTGQLPSRGSLCQWEALWAKNSAGFSGGSQLRTTTASTRTLKSVRKGKPTGRLLAAADQKQEKAGLKTRQDEEALSIQDLCGIWTTGPPTLSPSSQSTLSTWRKKNGPIGGSVLESPPKDPPRNNRGWNSRCLSA